MCWQSLAITDKVSRGASIHTTVYVLLVDSSEVENREDREVRENRGHVLVTRITKTSIECNPKLRSDSQVTQRARGLFSFLRNGVCIDHEAETMSTRKKSFPLTSSVE